MTKHEEQFTVRSVWPNGDITEAHYTSQPAAELESYLRKRYSQCKVTLFRREVVFTDWEQLTIAPQG